METLHAYMLITFNPDRLTRNQGQTYNVHRMNKCGAHFSEPTCDSMSVGGEMLVHVYTYWIGGS